MKHSEGKISMILTRLCTRKYSSERKRIGTLLLKKLDAKKRVSFKELSLLVKWGIWLAQNANIFQDKEMSSFHYAPQITTIITAL
jgi:hypothetical protein